MLGTPTGGNVPGNLPATMNPKTLFFSACSLLFTIAAQADEVIATIQQEARRCAQSLLASNYTAIMDYTHERVIEKNGGKEKMQNALELGLAGMKARGMKLLDAKIGDPQPPVKVGTWLVSVVPQTVVLEVRDNKVTQGSHLFGMSSDGGKTWKFIDVGPLNEQQLYSLFPELKGKVPLPPKSEPSVEKIPVPAPAAQ